MAKQNFEQTSFSGKIREYGVLYCFILFAGIASLILMNLFIFPFAVLAVKAPSVFTAIVKYGLISLFIVFAGYKIVRAILRLVRSEESFLVYIRQSIKRRSSSFLFGLIVSVSTIVLFLIIVLLLKYNYFYLYEILN